LTPNSLFPSGALAVLHKAERVAPAAISRGSGSFRSPTRRTYGLVVNCEFASETDPSVLRVLLKIRPRCRRRLRLGGVQQLRRRLTGSALRRESRPLTRALEVPEAFRPLADTIVTE
jgi:hypothetical protein